MCHRFGQRKRGTKFVTFRFSYFDACAGPGAGRAVFVEQPRWRADLPDPGSRPSTAAHVSGQSLRGGF